MHSAVAGGLPRSRSMMRTRSSVSILTTLLLLAFRCTSVLFFLSLLLLGLEEILFMFFQSIARLVPGVWHAVSCKRHKTIDASVSEVETL